MANPGIPVLTAEQTTSLLNQHDVLSALRHVFIRLAEEKAVQPDQQLVLLPEGRGDFINYFGADLHEGVLGVKISPYLVTGKKPIITAWTLLLSTTTGQPVLLCDASRLTTERTAATTVLAVEQLAPARASILTVVGTGPVAKAHIRYAASLRNWHEIRVVSRSNHITVGQLSEETGVDSARLALYPSVELAVTGADVVMLCTSSATPVIQPDWLTHPCLVTSISTNAMRAHEIPPEALSDMDVYCDYRATTPAQAGEMVIAESDYGWQRSAIRGDLPELVTGRCEKPDYQRHVFFRSLGLGIEDIAIAALIQTCWQNKDN
ncbi:MAG: NAD(P)H-dependent anabolic L-arginine dehydrogenase DauB [Candidatus Erwinia impunctatus]|nr:NAD(P)H-dependent anabolic L-arginine dehydrogenase DauB [Culicoides impunctatus]